MFFYTFQNRSIKLKVGFVDVKCIVKEHKSQYLSDDKNTIYSQ